ncbi:MAG: ABC transporter substrate-binding protein, partial [Anaerolineae bacterium]|nr:ABC transporter substrate-binding protein [Anaerolineae bacterium]
MKSYVVASLLIVLILLAAPVMAQPASNLTDGCAESYDAGVDYFPDKAEITHAEGLSIDYFGNYKVVTVFTPWFGAGENDAFTYVLTQCGTPVPIAATFPVGTQFVDVPTGNLIALSTTEMPRVASLGLIDQLIGLDSFLWTNTPEVVTKIDAGELIEVGNGASINIEQVLDAEPGLVITNGTGTPEYDAHPLLLEAGIPVAVDGDYVEPTLLGNAEWIKFLAAFYNQEAEANAVYDAVVADYEAAAQLAAGVPADQRETILYNSYQSFTESWSIPGQATWAGSLLLDAGVDYVLMDEAPDQPAQLSFEAVYDAGFDAPIWLLNTFGVGSLDDLVAQDARNADFDAVESGAVYNNDARQNINGGNDFWETGVNNPHLLLRD